MTEQDIIDMAEECGLAGYFELDGDSVGELMVQAFAKLVAKAKIEEIATACERLPFGDTAHSFAIWIREQ